MEYHIQNVIAGALVALVRLKRIEMKALTSGGSLPELEPVDDFLDAIDLVLDDDDDEDSGVAEDTD